MPKQKRRPKEAFERKATARDSKNKRRKLPCHLKRGASSAANMDRK